MQRLEVSGAVRPLYGSLGVRGLIIFEKLQTATVDFVMFVRPSGCLFAWNNQVPTGGIFMKFDI